MLVIFQCGNPQSTGPTGGKQASSVCVCVLAAGQFLPLYQTLSRVGCLVETDKPNRRRVTYFVAVCRWECVFPKLTPACSLQLALSLPPHPPTTSLLPPPSKTGKKKKPKIARQWMNDLDATPTDVVRTLPFSLSTPLQRHLIMKTLTHLHGYVWSKLHSKPHQIRIICECKTLFFLYLPPPPPLHHLLHPPVLCSSQWALQGTCSNDEGGGGDLQFLTFSGDLSSVPTRRLRGTGVTHNYPRIWSAPPPIPHPN